MAGITDVMTTVVTREKADALNDSEQMATAATTTMNASKDDVIDQEKLSIEGLTESGKEGVKEALDIARENIADQLNCSKDINAADLENAIKAIIGEVVVTANASVV